MGHQVNWLHARIRKDGPEPVLHAAVVFQAHESPIFDPAGPAVPPNAVAASVHQDWMPGEERVVSVSWIPDPSQSVALSARLMTRGLRYAPGTASEWATIAWKYRESITAIPDQEMFISLFLRNGLEKEGRPLLLELIRGAAPEPIDVILSHAVGLPVIVGPELANAFARSHDKSQASGDVKKVECFSTAGQTPVVTPVQEFLFPPDSRAEVLLLLHPQSVLIPALRFTIPAGTPNGDIIRFDVVARRPEDRVLVGGLALTITVERFD